MDLPTGPSTVPMIKIYDRANELRIQIVGRLDGRSVDDLANAWRSEMSSSSPRQCTVDISGLSGYDTPGCKLLREMHAHGTQFAAATPMSLVFFNEISAPRRRGPALVREKPAAREARPGPVYRRAAGE